MKEDLINFESSISLNKIAFYPSLSKFLNNTMFSRRTMRL